MERTSNDPIHTMKSLRIKKQFVSVALTEGNILKFS
jgi:hypothetical protein